MGVGGRMRNWNIKTASARKYPDGFTHAMYWAAGNSSSKWVLEGGCGTGIGGDINEDHNRDDENGSQEIRLNTKGKLSPELCGEER